jgi:chemotaxis protein CheD
MKAKRTVGIHIGELFAGKGPIVIQTTLGSCVAVCLYDREARVGGMNHIFLPGRADLKQFDNVARYGINAMELLINRVTTLGAMRRRLVAKVFGGAHVLPAITPENGVGSRNAEFVLEFLKIEDIPLISQDLGGSDARRIFFHTDTGAVFLKRIPSSLSPEIGLAERKLLDAARKKAAEAGDVTLFS